MGKKYYVYVLMDSSKRGEYIFGEYKFDYEPFYIGKGCGDRIKNTIYDSSKFKSNKINKLRDSDIEIKSEKIYDCLSNEESISLEKKLIKLIGRRDLSMGTLVNVTDGGDGRINSNHSRETIDKISKNRTGKGIGWTHSEITLKKMSENQRGVGNGFYGMTHSLESKNKISIKNFGKNHSMYNKNHNTEIRNKIRMGRKNLSNDRLKEICQSFNKEVDLYSLDMTFIEKFKSVKEASIRTGINESIISKCCRGEIMNPTRYFFKYSNVCDKIKNNKYLINIGDSIPFGTKKKYTLIKRNKKSAIMVCNGSGEEVSIRYSDLRILTQKDSNDSDFAELYIFLRGHGNFKVDRKLKKIYNDNLIIYYNKLLNSSELFLDKMEIYNRYSDDKKTINIFEDQWRDKKDIIKSRLLNNLNKSNKIYARKCVIKEVPYKEKKDFIDSNHIQGDVRSRINIGLYYKDELVSIMTFGGLRKNLGQVSKEGSFELLRFCNKINMSIVGGASKLFKYFTRNYDVLEVISYADRSWSSGNLYQKLGFTISDNKIIPNYFYIIDGQRKNRFGYRKDILVSSGYDPKMTEVEIQHSRGYYRIFDTGSFKYIWKN